MRLSHLALLFTLILFSSSKAQLSTTWNLEASTVAESMKWPIGAYCNITGKIWIFGGSANAKSVMSFDPTKTTGAVSTHSAASSNFKVRTRNRIYDGIYYFSFQGSSYISQFFTSTVSFNYQFAQHPNTYTDFYAVPYKIGSDLVIFCLGDSSVKELHILNASSLNWNQGQSYSVWQPPIITNTRIYHIVYTQAEYIDISGSIEDIISRDWQTSSYTGSSLQYRTSQITAFYNKYSRNYELWTWGGYAPGPTFQMSGIRVIDTVTFAVSSANTHTSFADALSVYVDFQDKWYVIAGHYGSNKNTIYSVDYNDTYSPTSNPSPEPTQYPTSVTMKPTIDPTSDPTNIPTQIPTLNPTNDPTCDPTLVPTMFPTDGPSSAPTSPPSKSPTFAPSLSPTDSPTNPPTAAPTLAPTAAPSIAPSQSPTACVDYFNYTSLDGIDVVHEIQSDHDVLYQNQSFPSNVTVQQHISTEIDGYYVNEDIICDNYNSDEEVCFIGCYDSAHCAWATIYCVEETEWKEIRIICSDKKSCAKLVVNITSTEVETLSILCGETFACEEAQFKIDIASDIEISIDCNELFSCKDLYIDLLRSDVSQYNEMKIDVTCFGDHSCDNMIINTDHSPKIFINLHAVRYSEDITIIYHFWQNIKVLCGYYGDHRYIRYDTHQLLESYEILQLARDEYETRKLPCEDIHILCSNNTHFDRECEYKYALNNISLSEILMDEDRASCYWMDIGQLYKARCEGTCEDHTQYKTYNKSFDLDLVLEDSSDESSDESDDEQRRLQNIDDEDNDSQENGTKSYRICDEYFGSVNATEDSLSSIDAIFDNVFDLMISIDDSLIHSLLFPPETMLQNNLLEIKCRNEEKNTIRITTNVSIETLYTLHYWCIKSIYAYLTTTFLTFESKILNL